MSNIKERGLLITLEGLDRAGKTTQAKMLEEYLNSIDKPTKIMRFPGKYFFIEIFKGIYRKKHFSWPNHQLLFTRQF